MNPIPHPYSVFCVVDVLFYTCGVCVTIALCVCVCVSSCSRGGMFVYRKSLSSIRFKKVHNLEHSFRAQLYKDYYPFEPLNDPTRDFDPSRKLPDVPGCALFVRLTEEHSDRGAVCEYTVRWRRKVW